MEKHIKSLIIKKTIVVAISVFVIVYTEICFKQHKDWDHDKSDPLATFCIAQGDYKETQDLLNMYTQPPKHPAKPEQNTFYYKNKMVRLTPRLDFLIEELKNSMKLQYDKNNEVIHEWPQRREFEKIIKRNSWFTLWPFPFRISEKSVYLKLQSDNLYYYDQELKEMEINDDFCNVKIGSKVFEISKEVVLQLFEEVKEAAYIPLQNIKVQKRKIDNSFFLIRPPRLDEMQALVDRNKNIDDMILKKDFSIDEDFYYYWRGTYHEANEQVLNEFEKLLNTRKNGYFFPNQYLPNRYDDCDLLFCHPKYGCVAVYKNAFLKFNAKDSDFPKAKIVFIDLGHTYDVDKEQTRLFFNQINLSINND